VQICSHSRIISFPFGVRRVAFMNTRLGFPGIWLATMLMVKWRYRNDRVSSGPALQSSSVSEPSLIAIKRAGIAVANAGILLFYAYLRHHGSLPDLRTKHVDRLFTTISGSHTKRAYSSVPAFLIGFSYWMLMNQDVQLTKDDVPIIYHDFLMSETGIDAPLHHLDLEQVASHSLRTSVFRALTNPCSSCTLVTRNRLTKVMTTHPEMNIDSAHIRWMYASSRTQKVLSSV
jgi:hypothetical protein